MYDVAARVLDWLAQGKQVSVARVVALLGVGAERPAEALVWTPGEPAAGSLLSGSLPAARIDAARRGPADVVDVVVPVRDAKAAGLPCGGRVTALVQPATQIPEQAWRLLAEREPVCLVTDLGGAETGRTSWFTVDSVASGHDDAVGGGSVRHPGQSLRLFGEGVSRAAVTELADGRQALLAAYWPTPSLLMVGSGTIAEALRQAAQLLGWTPVVRPDAGAVDAVAELARGDAVVVLSHDLELSGRVLTAALRRPLRYVGALGSRRTQTSRARWLATHGVPAEAVASVHGPAGLDIGARTPAEIALSITAEILAVCNNATGGTLRDRPGPVHLDRAAGRPWTATS